MSHGIQLVPSTKHTAGSIEEVWDFRKETIIRRKPITCSKDVVHPRLALISQDCLLPNSLCLFQNLRRKFFHQLTLSLERRPFCKHRFSLDLLESPADIPLNVVVAMFQNYFLFFQCEIRLRILSFTECPLQIRKCIRFVITCARSIFEILMRGNMFQLNMLALYVPRLAAPVKPWAPSSSYSLSFGNSSLREGSIVARESVLIVKVSFRDNP